MTTLPKYESLVLVPTESTNDDISTIERQLDELCTQSGGSLISFDRWGKYQLCFPVRKHSYGIYLLARFEVAADKAPVALKNVENLFRVRHSELVMRHVTLKLDDNASLAYEKPESLDVARAGSIDGLKEEAKIEHLLDAVDASSQAVE